MPRGANNTTVYAYCQDGCGKRLPRRNSCAACKREKRRLAALHQLTMDTSAQCDAERARRIPVYQKRAALGLPLFD